MVILSATGQIYEAPDDIRDDVCFLDGKGLFVADRLKNNLLLREYIHGLKIRNVVFEIEYLSIVELKSKVSRLTKGNKTKRTSAEEEATNLLKKAKDLGASDVHIRVNSTKDFTEIRMRILGDLEKIESDSDDSVDDAEYGLGLCRILAGIMTDKNAKGQSSFVASQPSSSRIGHHEGLPEGLNGIRLENVPTNTGNKMTARLLYDSVNGATSLSALGFSGSHESVFKLFRKSVHGLILFSGPTGSGKSTSMNRYLTLYQEEYEDKRSIYTIEDPVEQTIEGADQTEIPHCDSIEERNAEFTRLLSSGLRSDPDAVMVGEIRDKPSASLSMQASMTGHQVLGTLHANNALGSLMRLVDLGVPEELVFDANNVIGLVSQRLLRVLCEDCKVPILQSEGRIPRRDYDRVMQAGINAEHVYVNGGGCDCCSGRGVTTRAVAAQVIKTDMMLMDFLRNKDMLSASDHIKRQIQAKSMIEHALSKINQGIVDPFDAEAVLGVLNMHVIESDSKIEMSEIERVMPSEQQERRG